eukprot:GFYU01021550.1.p2 GENE.GFYU01021550.1~~GFYU01021550.1.p2  ORF type:complete len:219 (+),score=50.98 GFYU01021550.1:1120-1776(+)
MPTTGQPDTLSFPPYTREDIKFIITQRLAAAGAGLIEPAAVELCARKVSAMSGDIRKALSVCRKVLSVAADKQDQEKENVGPAPAGDKWAIGMIDMGQVVNEVFGSPYIDIIRSLPTHQQLLLCAAAIHFQKNEKEVLLPKLHSIYSRLCQQKDLNAASVSDFSDFCRCLVDSGILNVKRAKDNRKTKIALAVQNKDIVFALRRNPFFKQMILSEIKS